MKSVESKNGILRPSAVNIVAISASKRNNKGTINRLYPNNWNDYTQEEDLMAQDIDKTDKRLLAELQENSARSVGDIADKVGISKTAAWRRIKKLIETGVIKSQVALLDPNKLKLPLTAYISLRTSQHNEAWFQNFKDVLNTIPEVLEVYRMSGELDYLIKAHVCDMAGYDQLYKQLIKAELNDVNCSFVMETLKHTTQLPLSQA